MTLKSRRSFSGCVIFALLICAPTFAFNHPEIEWKSVSTRHFIINYYDRTEPAVYAAWKIAEETYDILAELYDYKLIDKINISLADYEDYSNGWASWPDRNVGIWLPDANFDLRGNTTWLRNVITHELTHIMSMEKEKGMQLLSWNLALDYASPSAGITLTEPVSFMTFAPMWFAEGTAQMGAERMSADAIDSRRDMVLRCAALDNKLLTLDEMGHFTHDWIGNEMVYNQGYALARHIESRFGKDKVALLWKQSRERKLSGRAFHRHFEETFGVSAESVYDEWRDSVKAAAERKIPRNLTASRAIWSPAFGSGTLNQVPRQSRDSRYTGFLTNQHDDFRRTDLVVLSSDGEIAARIRYARTAWDFFPGGRRVAYVKTRDPDSDGCFYNDIFSYSMNERTETRLTYSARVYDFAVAPDGQSIVCVRFANGAFFLDRFFPSTGTFERILDGETGCPFLKISFAPSSSDTIAVSRIQSGQSDIFVTSLSQPDLKPLVSTAAQEIDPHWGPDNRIYFSADYDGIFNVYSVKADGSGLLRHTNMKGGAFSPWLCGNGSLMMSEYGSGGFRIAECKPANTPFTAPDPAAHSVFKPLPQPKGTVTIKNKDYNPRLLRPLWQMSSVAMLMDSADNLRRSLTGRSAGSDIQTAFSTSLMMERFDALQKKYMAIGVAGQITPQKVAANDSTALAMGHDMRPFCRVSRPAGRTQPLHLRMSATASAPDMLPGIRAGMRGTGVLSADGDSGNASDSMTLPVPDLVPFLARYNRSFPATIGIEGQAIIRLMYPLALEIAPFFEYRLGRDLYCGVSTDIFALLPLLITTGYGVMFDVPFWISWVRTGYINEDFDYNNAGLSRLAFSAGPYMSPIIKISHPNAVSDSADTTIANMIALNCGLNASYALRLFPHVTLNLSTDDFYALSSDEYEDNAGYLHAASRQYFQVNGRSEIRFPVFRNINRPRLYADNLYGAVFHDATIYGNDNFSAAGYARALSDPDNDSAAVAVFHRTGARLDLGFIKQYMFSRRLSVGASWEFVHKQVFVEFRMLM